MSERGVFGVDRGIWDHPILNGRRSFSRREAWLWLLSEAAWKSRRVRHAGETFTISRGQLAHSIRFMAKAWRWEQTKVVRFLNDLKTETMIATGTATGITIITICNYDKYQIVGLPDATPDATENATGTQQQRNSNATNKKNLNIEEGKNDDGKVASLITEPAYALADDLAKICGHPSPDLWPPGWCGAPLWVQKCLNEGWSPDVMRAEARAVAGRKRDGPIDYFRYLEKPLAQAQARHQAPLPKVEVPQQEVIRGSNNLRSGSSILAAIDRLPDGRGEAEHENAVLRLPKG